jgi:hypothetical protein
MSGVEAAGLVLATFPLLISALEHYRASAEVLEDWWQIKREYLWCMNEIEVYQLGFEQNLRKYLLPLIADDNKIEELIRQPGSPSWKTPELEEKLKARLPRAYNLYIATINQMIDSMKRLHAAVGTNKIPFQQGLGVTEVSHLLNLFHGQDCP